MKTDTLKFKAVMLAIAFASLSQTSIHAMNVDDPMDLELTSEEQQKERENQFIEQMFIEIRDAVNTTIDLVESFMDKTNKESFTAFIGRCADQIKYIEDNILAPLEAEVAVAKATQPNSDYCKALEKTLKFGKEQAYKELVTFYTTLDNHRQSPNKKNATALVTLLKPDLQKLISVTTLDMLDKSLADINQHLDSTGQVAQEIANLKAMVKDIRTKAAAMQGKVNAGLLTIISARLQRL